MTGADIPRYRPTFRLAEVALIRSSAARGQSLCLVGVAGVGKTNLIHFLRYAGAAQAGGPPWLLFAHVDCRQWTQTPQSLWDLMLDGLIRCDDVAPPAERADAALTEEARSRQRLFNCAAQTCRDPQTRLMFLLDDFDDLLVQGPLEMLEALNTLRGECRDRLSYLIFTKRLPHVLGRAYDLQTASKFHQLFEGRIYALPLLNAADARQMAERLNFVNGRILTRPELSRITQLAGGHSGLLRAVYEARRELGPLKDDPIAELVAHPGVRAAAQRLFRSLHPAEQAAAVRLAQRRLWPDDLDLIDHLRTRGLLIRLNSTAWFSPVWEYYLRECAGEDAQP